MTVPLVVDYLEHQKLTNVFNNLDQESHNKTYKSMKVKGVSNLKARLDYSYNHYGNTGCGVFKRGVQN